MSIINIDHLTKDYGKGRGVFDISIEINEGETVGFAGTNGAGKTTTIRHLMGFIKPDSGKAVINGLDCWQESAEIKKSIGYIPGEIAFPDAPTGIEFLRRQGELLGHKDIKYGEEVFKKLQLDPTANLKRMSKGMKQKTAIAAAFMHNPNILILDEPTTGLDPLMRNSFIEILREEKKKGKTILMSSHMFDELQDICDRVVLIKAGKIISVVSTSEIRHNKDKKYKIEFSTIKDYDSFLKEGFKIRENDSTRKQLILEINDSQVNKMTCILFKYNIKYFKEIKSTLEQYFDNVYKENKYNA